MLCDATYLCVPVKRTGLSSSTNIYKVGIYPVIMLRHLVGVVKALLPTMASNVNGTSIIKLFHRSKSKATVTLVGNGHPTVIVPEDYRNTTDSVFVYFIIDTGMSSSDRRTPEIRRVASIYRVGNVNIPAAATFIAHVTLVGAEPAQQNAYRVLPQKQIQGNR